MTKRLKIFMLTHHNQVGQYYLHDMQYMQEVFRLYLSVGVVLSQVMHQKIKFSYRSLNQKQCLAELLLRHIFCIISIFFPISRSNC